MAMLSDTHCKYLCHQYLNNLSTVKSVELHTLVLEPLQTTLISALENLGLVENVQRSSEAEEDYWFMNRVVLGLRMKKLLH